MCKPLSIVICGILLIVAGCANLNLHTKIDQNPALNPEEKAYANLFLPLIPEQSIFVARKIQKLGTLFP